MKYTLKTVATWIGQQLLPSCCVLCKKRCDGWLCPYCRHDINQPAFTCQGCGLALPNNDSTCGQCLQHAPYFDHLITIGDFRGQLSELITGLKFHRQLSYGQALGKLLLQRVQTDYKHTPLPQLLLPVPLHYKRIRERGFNQSIEIARPLKQQLHIPIDRFSCKRSKYTQAQMQLDKKARKHNLRDAFTIVQPIKAKHIAIIDDVVTTMHTVNSLAKTLAAHGASHIDVWCCARTQAHY